MRMEGGGDCVQTPTNSSVLDERGTHGGSVDSEKRGGTTRGIKPRNRGEKQLTGRPRDLKSSSPVTWEQR